jgi:pyruvate dehydrogenase E2 component (dihydrolipoamide acetyltransferase)
MEMGTIAKWELKEGDSFSAGSVICSIETDKATMDFEAQDDGIIAKILRAGPDAVDLAIGSPIAVVVEEQDDVAAFADYVLEGEASAGTAHVPTPTPAAAPVVSSATPVVGGQTGNSILLPSARFLAESRYVFCQMKRSVAIWILLLDDFFELCSPNFFLFLILMIVIRFLPGLYCITEDWMLLD